MIISCDKCEKKFDVDSNLIPKEGRLLQCSSCNHQWFYTFVEQVDKSIIPKSTKLKKIPDIPVKGFVNNVKKKTKKKHNDTSKSEYFDTDEISQSKKNKKNITFLNFIFVFIISSVALLIIFETFNETIEYYFPNLDSIVENLYETIIDIFLFIKDLFK
tara:strand:+ start:42 stop:518 length:477 start_codon:yes stop_codon:yes gene_type:complete